MVKYFTRNDLEPVKSEYGDYWRLSVDPEDFVDAPMWFHKHGLQETTSGYGKRLNTGKKLWFNNRLYRVYCCIFSNNGTCYIRTKKYGEVVVS